MWKAIPDMDDAELAEARQEISDRLRRVAGHKRAARLEERLAAIDAEIERRRQHADRLEVEIRMLRGTLDAISHGGDGVASKLAAIAACGLRESRDRVALSAEVESRSLVGGAA